MIIFELREHHHSFLPQTPKLITESKGKKTNQPQTCMNNDTKLLKSFRSIHHKNNSHTGLFQKPSHSVILANSKTMVSLPQHGEKEVLEDIPLFVCYDTTFKRKGKSAGLERCRTSCSYLLPSTVKLFLEKATSYLWHQVQNHQSVLLPPAFLFRGPTPTGQDNSVIVRSGREDARQLKVIL